MAELRYGDGATAHRTGTIDIEIGPDGKVAGVWFRCMYLPFTQAVVGPDRARVLNDIYKDTKHKLIAVVVDDEKAMPPPELGV